MQKYGKIRRQPNMKAIIIIKNNFYSKLIMNNMFKKQPIFCE